ncbi:MAG: ATP-dependent DNA helicase [Synergistales bacterium]
MDSYFGRSGHLSGMRGFEFRPQQAEMARKTWDLLNSGKGGILAMEAPTGVGKSFALLIPSLLWALEEDRAVMLLTAGHALQEQLVSKDLPFLQELLPGPFRYGTLKGRRNYLCLRRSLELDSGGFLSFGDGGTTSAGVLQWSRETKTGDLSELDLPESHPVLGMIAASREGCLGMLCPFREECHLQRLYLEAREWHLIVANYHLFFSHLDGGERSFPISFDALLCDEAHRIPEAARSAASRSASPERFRRILSPRHLNSLEKSFRCLRISEGNLQAEWGRAALGVERLFNRLSLLPKDQWLFKEPLTEFRHDLEDSSKSLTAEAERFISSVPKDVEKPPSIGTAPDWAEGLATAAQLVEAFEEFAWCLDVARYPHWATWWDGAQIQSAPVLAGPSVREALLSVQEVPIVCSSATLSVGGSFDFWENEAGISPQECLVLDSPFDLPSQMSIWVVELELRVMECGYDEKASRVIEKLCEENGGRTLVLCSSRRLVDAVSRRMKRKERRYRLLCQGEAPKGELLETFRTDETSVLIGSLSFREGIDIPGEGLTQVILDRIPFPHPDDPLVRARRDLEGREAFSRSTLPMSRLFLRQAFGRLIRRKTDLGRVVILDGRALGRPDWRIFQDFPGVPIRRIRLSPTP